MRILLCVAGMPYATATLRVGGAIARVLQAEVTVCHVCPWDEEEAGAAVLEEAEAILPELDVVCHLCMGKPVPQILQEVAAQSYDLLVIGASQGIPLLRRLAGSVPLQIARRAPSSVLVVKGGRWRLRRFLICTGGSDVARPVIEMGGRLARGAGAEVTLLHVASPVPSMYTGLSEIEETLSELLQSDTPIARHLRQGAEILAQKEVQAELKLRYGVPADEILAEAQEGDYDLIVIGASGAGGWVKRWLMGNVTQHVIEAAHRPVLVVRPA